MGYTNAFQNPLPGKALDAKRTELWSSPATEQPRTWKVQRKNDHSLDNRSRSRQKTKPMPITGYDAQAILEFYDRRPLQVGWRLNSFGIPLLGMFDFILFDNPL
jgi:hypothetical protein